MQIVVFKSSKNKSISYKLNGYLFIFIIIASIIALSYLFGSASYIYGYKKGYSELNDDRISDIQKRLRDSEFCLLNFKFLVKEVE